MDSIRNKFFGSIRTWNKPNALSSYNLVKQVALLDMACNKEQKKNARYGFNSVASGSICVDEEDLAETINKIGYPIVLKPSMEITEKALRSMSNWEDAGLVSPKEYSRRIIVEFITGFDFRILVIDNKLVAACAYLRT
jgi:cyanophycin synthetase